MKRIRRAPLTVVMLLITLQYVSAAGEVTISPSFSIPLVDLSQDADRQVVVAAGTEEVYQGHPTTVLLPDGKTIYAVWTYNHGGECGPMKRSDDGGKSWSELLPVPESWRKVRNCPAIYRLVDPEGQARLLVFAQLGDGLVSAHSEDDGKTWTDMRPIEGLNMEKSVMPWCTIVPIEGGKKLLAGTNARRANDPDKRSNNVVQSISSDGGLTWGPVRIICDMPGFKPCEPCFLRSPDGKQLLCLMRENMRTINSLFMVSDDEGKTWSQPKSVQGSLTGDRHQARYAADGRLVIVFRDMAPESPTRGHFVGWVGMYDDIVNQREGQYRLKLLHNYAATDCGYPGLELLSDGTFVATTYLKYWNDQRKHSVVSTRFKMEELDAREDRTCVVFEGKSPNKLVCDTTLRRLPDGSWVLVMLGDGDTEPMPANRVFLGRSSDQGKTWSAMEPINLGVKERDPSKALCPVELMVLGDRCTLVVSVHNGGFGQWKTYFTHSTDGCRTWSALEPAPGKLADRSFIRNHIMTRDGRILMPYQWYTHCDEEARKISLGRFIHTPRDPRNGVIASSDGGKTWEIYGNIRLTEDENHHCWAEANIVELADGTIAMIIRADGLGGVLYCAESKDGGRTWPEFAEKTDIPNPGSKATLYRLGGDRVALLHNPNPKHRSPLALWISFDRLKTWPYRRVLVPESVDKGGWLNYPDGFVSPDGRYLHFAFDDNRHRAVYYGAAIPMVQKTGD